MRQLIWIFILAAIVLTIPAYTYATDHTPTGRKAPPLSEIPLSSGIKDPYLDASWHLKAIRAFEAWNITEGNPKTIVAVVDGGIDYNHPELRANIFVKTAELPENKKDKDGNDFPDDAIGWDFVLGNHLPYDRNGHGTYIAGLIAGVRDNGLGSSGVCPKCNLMGVRFANRDGEGDTEAAIEAIRYAVNEGASVINYSFVGEGYDGDLYDILDFAREKDVLVVVAAGNDSMNIDREAIYPPRYKIPTILTVTGTTPDDELNERSNWGRHTVHVGAPGEGLIGPWLDEDYWLEGAGTSFAAPIVAGVAGLIRSAAPNLSALQVKEIILATARKSAGLKRKVMSQGVVDAAAALHCAVDQNLPCLKPSLR